MPEITFIVDPGADDILIDGISLNDIDAFRDECLTAGAVSCDWDTLHTRLIGHDVAGFWWFLSKSERRSVAEQAIKNTMFYDIYKYRGGRPNCEGGIGEWKSAPCMMDAVIRYMKFSVHTEGSDGCYWQDPNENEVCYVPDNRYNLPCNVVQCSSGSYGHTLCAIQVVHNPQVLGDWIIFQYSDYDIKPGHKQLPFETRVRMYYPHNFRCTGIDEYDIIAEFYI